MATSMRAEVDQLSLQLEKLMNKTAEGAMPGEATRLRAMMRKASAAANYLQAEEYRVSMLNRPMPPPTNII